MSVTLTAAVTLACGQVFGRGLSRDLGCYIGDGCGSSSSRATVAVVVAMALGVSLATVTCDHGQACGWEKKHTFGVTTRATGPNGCRLQHSMTMSRSRLRQQQRDTD